MSSNIKKPSVCNRCYLYVNWNKEKRASMNTTRPLNKEGTAVHECPKDGNGNIIINFENKAVYDAAVAAGPNPATVQSLTPPPSATAAAQQQQGLSQGDVSQILAVMMNKIGELATQQKQFTDAVLRIESVIEAQKKILTEYINYDPVGTQLNRLIDTLIKYVPSQELRPRPADEILNPPSTTTTTTTTSNKKTQRSAADVEKLQEDEYLSEKNYGRGGSD